METILFSQKDVDTCKEFAQKISWKHPHFRDKRNTETRSFKQVAEDVLRGRLAEIAVQKYLRKEFGSLVSDLDFELYPKGVTDDADIQVGDIRISIKSSKPNSSCLMIETAKFDLTRNGELMGVDRKPSPDFFIFVQVDVSKMEAIICGAISMNEFWRKKRFMPRGMWMNRQNAKDFFLRHMKPHQLVRGKGGSLLADNYGVHIHALKNPSSLIKEKLQSKSVA